MCLKVCVSADEKYAAVGDELGFFYLILLRKKIVEKQVHAHMGSLRDISFTPDSLKLITGGGDSKIIIWTIDTMDQVLLKGHQQSIYSLCISYNGLLIASGSSDKTLRLWDSTNGNLKSTLQAQDHITCVAFDRNNEYIISGGSSGMVKI